MNIGIGKSAVVDANLVNHADGLPRLTTQNLSELFSQYVRQTEQHERFGQYVMNRTRFAIDNVHGVNVWNEKDANKVYNALFTYLCEIQA